MPERTATLYVESATYGYFLESGRQSRGSPPKILNPIWTSLRHGAPLRPLLRVSFWLAAVSLILPLTPVPAAAQTSCSQSPSWKALIATGANQQLTAATRKRAYLKAQVLCPRNATAYEGLATLSLERRDYTAARAWIQHGLAVAPHDPALALAEGVLLLSTGHPEAALRRLETLPPSAKSEFYLGMAYRALRNHSAAQQAFSNAFATGDREPYVLYDLIEQDRALHDQERGMQDFRTFYELFPHSAWLHLLMGNAYFSRHDAEGAQSEYEEAARLDPNLPLAHFDLGRLAFDQGKYAEALADFRKEISVDPGFGEAYLYAGTSLRRLGKNQDSLPFLKSAVARDPQYDLAYREIAAAQIQAGDWAGAQRTLEAGEQHFSKEAAFPAQLARVLAKLGRSAEAAEQSRLAEGLSRRSNVQLSAQAGAGRAPSSAPLPSSAIQQLQTCVERSDARCALAALGRADDASLANSPAYLNLKAEALNIARREKPALAAIDRAIQLDPHQPDYFITQGRIEQQMENQPAAIKSFLSAERLRPGSEAPVYYLGMSFFMLGYDNNDNGDYDRAARHFRAALEVNPRDDRALFMLGVVNAIEFRTAEARKDFEFALKVNPRNPYYHLHYGMLLSRTGHVAEGEQEMKLAEKLDPSYSRTYLHLGDVEAQLGNYSEARAQLEAAVRLDPQLAPAYYTLGRIYYRLGLNAKSQTALRKFEQMKAQQQKETDPMGAALSAVSRSVGRRQRTVGSKP